MNRIRVLLADDHTLVRAGIRSLLGEIPTVDVVAEAGSGQQAVELAATLNPDIVLMDVSMQDLGGLDAAEAIMKKSPSTRVIMLSMYDAEEYVTRAFRVGASGYVLKDAAPEELEFALRAVSSGETYLSPRVSSRVVERYAGRSVENRGEPGLDLLSPRQIEILKAIAEGGSTKEIAFDLGVSVKTVETHRAQIMERLDTRDIAGLVRFAVRVGLVSLDR